MNASALARELDNLEKSWSASDSLLNLWTLLVVVGVTLEIFVIAAEYWHEWKEFKRSTIHTPEKPSLMLFGLGMLGAGLVAVGVAGEFRIHIKAGVTESQIRDKTRQLVAIVEGDAGKANERAGQANERAEKEALARVELEKSLQWRHLSPGAKRALCTFLPPQRMESLTMVVTSWNDPEPAQYAKEFRDTIAACRPMPLPAGYDRHQAPGGDMSPWPSRVSLGVALEFPAKDEPAAKLLNAALRANGVDSFIPSGKERHFSTAITNRAIIVWPRAFEAMHELGIIR
jgi:hypothetical protein